jgi:hypothetical protein
MGDRVVRRPCRPEWMPWPCVLTGEAKASRLGGRLATGDEDPTPEPCAAAAGSTGRFLEHLVCDAGKVFNLNTKRAADQAWDHPSPTGHNRPNRVGRCCSGSLSGLFAHGPSGPNPNGPLWPTNTFGPLKAHQPLTADVMLTSASFLIKILFYFQNDFRNVL